MADDPDEDRIRRKAHELWEAEGHPHGRDLDHWEQAREIVAIEDSLKDTLLPRTTGANEPVESSTLRASHGDVPNLTDQGEHDLTSVSRETVGLTPAPMDPLKSDEVVSFAETIPPAPKPKAPPIAGKKTMAAPAAAKPQKPGPVKGR